MELDPETEAIVTIGSKEGIAHLALATIGPGDVVLTPIATPGHAPGALTWSWTSCEEGVCRRIVYADSLSPFSRDGYRFSDHPDYLKAYRASIAKVAALPCDILLTPHPSASDMVKRLALGNPLYDPNACKAYAAHASAVLEGGAATEPPK